MRYLWVILILFFQPLLSFAVEKITVDFQHIKTADAIYYLAKFSHLNIVVNPAIQGEVALHLQQVDPLLALDALLATQDLMKSNIGTGWFITPRTEFMRHQQDQFKLQEISDESAALTAELWHVRYAKADDIAHFIQDTSNSLLSKRGLVRADTRTNSIYVQETPERLTRIKILLQRLDVPVQQVLIEARLATIDHDFERELGLQFGVQTADDTVQSNAHRFSLAVARLADGSWLDVKLAALEKEGHGELISSPSLFTANQQTASIESGEEIPYQETSRNGATTIAFKKAVLSLKVTPQILPGQQVLLQLQVNQDKPTDRLVLGVPAIETRQLMTNVLIQAGQTIVLGGIYEINQENNTERLPFFGNIPVLKDVFSQHTTKRGKRELLIFVTPRLIANTHQIEKTA